MEHTNHSLSDDVDESDNYEEIDLDDIKEEPDEVVKTKKGDDFISMAMDGLSAINIKMLILLFLVYIFINSDVFIDNVLSRIKNTTESGILTSKGVIVCGIVLILAHVLIDILINSGTI